MALSILIPADEIGSAYNQYQDPGEHDASIRITIILIITTGVDFIPVMIETFGTLGEQAFHLVMEIARLLATVTHEPRSTAFLRQCLSVAIQRGNAFCVTETFRRSKSAVTAI